MSVDPRARFDSDDVSWLEHPDRQVEGQWVERKEWCQARQIAEAISAFANGQPPGGLFVLGVSRDGKIVGLDERWSKVEQMLTEVHDIVEACGWTWRPVSDPDHSKRLIFVFVPFSGNRVVCVSNGDAFQRVGEATRKLSPDEKQNLRYARGELHFEDEPAMPYTEEVVDPELAQALLDGMRKRNGLTMPLTLESALDSRTLLAHTSRGTFLTNAGLLALGKNPSSKLGGARLRFLRFEGTRERFGTERNVVKDRWFDGAIPRIVNQFREFMRTQVREFDYLGPEGKFVTDVEYPEFAWVEAVVNALVHRTYRSNETVFVRMFDDRLEIESPGGLPQPGLTSPVEIDRLRSNPRNPHLCAVLQYFELVRMVREGTRRMRDEMVGMGLPAPIISESELRDGVTVTLVNDIERRRARAGAGDASKAWSEVAGYLRETHVIFRRRAIGKWRVLWDQGARPPAELVELAVETFKNDGLPPGETDELLVMLARARDGVSRPVLSEAQLVQLAGELTRGSFASNPRVESGIANVVSYSGAGLERVIVWLERDTPDRATCERVLDAFRGRLARDPLPPGDIMERLAALGLRYADTPAGKGLYVDITGRDPPRD